jgi:hypothetical protein
MDIYQCAELEESYVEFVKSKEAVYVEYIDDLENILNWEMFANIQ